MAEETVRLARFAASLRYQDLPDDVVQRAKECIADTVAGSSAAPRCRGAGLSSTMPGVPDPAAIAIFLAPAARR